MQFRYCASPWTLLPIRRYGTMDSFFNLKVKERFQIRFCLDDECWRSYEQKVLGIIGQALRGRTKLVRVVWRNTSPDCNFEDVWYSSFLLLFEEAFKKAVVCPSPEDKDKAAEFRKFWWDKATLRWFHDGKIAEVAEEWGTDDN